MTIRLGGLVTGIDTESIIKASLQPIQQRIDRQSQLAEIVEYRKQEYMSFNTKLLTLRTKSLDLKLESTFTSKEAVSSDESVLTATASADAVNGVYDIKVNSLATRVAVNSTAALGSSGDATSIATQFGLDESAVVSFTLKGSEGEVTLRSAAGDFSMDDLIQGINDAEIGVTAWYDEGTDRVYMNSSTYGTDATLSVKQDGVEGTGQGFLTDILKLDFDYTSLNYPTGAPVSRQIANSEAIATTNPPASTTLASFYGSGETVPTTVYFTLEGYLGSADYALGTTTTLSGLAAAINADTATTGLTAAYDEGTGSFTLTGAEDPANPGSALVAIRGDYTSADQRLGFLGDKLKLSMDSVSGSGAEIEYNGTPLTMDSNEFTLNDINYSLINASEGDIVRVTVSADTDKAVEKITAFVEAYNEIVDYCYTKLNESKYKDSSDKYAEFMPLTDEQREAMTETEIELWDAKWKQGQMANESLLRSVYNSLRHIASDMITDKGTAENIADSSSLVSTVLYRSLSAIGITTPQYEQGSSDNGKLQIDENALREALETDAESVCKLFTLTQTVSHDGTTTKYDVGLGLRFYEEIDTSISLIGAKAGWGNSTYDTSYMQKELYRYAEKIYDLQVYYDEQETTLWNRYASLETAIAQLQAQSASFAAKMGTGTEQ